MTTEEIVRALRVCGKHSCMGCAYKIDECDQMVDDAADAIERLSAENADLHKELEWKDMVISLAQRKQAEAEAERDALLPCAKEYGCATCKNEKACFVQTREGVTVSCVKCPIPDSCPCSKCKDRDKWEWSGLPEAPEEEKT